LLGSVLEARGELAEASSLYHKALKQQELIDNKKGISDVRLCLGNMANTAGDHTAAEVHYKYCLEAASAIKDGERLANAYSSLGTIYRLSNVDKAEKMYLKALAINRKLEWKEGIANAHTCLGILHQMRGDFREAETMHLKALTLNQELGSKLGQAIAYANLARVFESRDELDHAEAAYLTALKIEQDLGYKEGIALTHQNLGYVLYQKGALARAHESWRKATETWTQMGLTARAAALTPFLKLGDVKSPADNPKTRKGRTKRRRQ
jgi:tetratricopeptide (TPR) repeat protein